MLNKKRIQEAESNVRSYMDERLIKQEEFQEIVFRVLINNARESLDLSNFIFKNNKSDLWVIVSSYYSMYYIANAVLYKKGYKIGDKMSHKVTADALIVFIRNKLKNSLIESYEELKEEALAGIKTDNLLSSFDFERRKRNMIQYETEEFEKHSKAKTSLDRAKEFMLEMEKLIC